MKAVFFETPEQDEDALGVMLAKTTQTTYTFAHEKLTGNNLDLAKDAEVVSIFVESKIDKEIIDRLPNLKLIATRSTGFDHVDVAYAKGKGIVVCNVPAYGSRTVAEFTFALILSLSRKLFVAADQIKEGKGFDYQAFEGFNLQGKTLGIVGTGRIGLNVAQIAKGFDMNILGFDIYPNEQKAGEYGFKYVNLDELLANSNVISLHVPYSKETRHLINKNNIRKIKKGALLINTARGEVADTEALLVALKDGTLAGAGLDVLEGERELKDEATLIAHYDPKHPNLDELKVLIEDHALINMPNVIITPHIAFYSTEAKNEILKITVENIISFIQGKPNNQV